MISKIDRIQLSLDPQATPIAVWRLAHEAMATTFEILAVHEDADYVRQAAEAVFEEVDRIEGELSRFRPGSDIARLNALSAGQRLKLGLDTSQSLEIAEEIMQATGGAFDVTIGPLLQWWQQHSNETPNPDLLKPIREKTGFHKLRFDAQSRQATPKVNGMQVDLGGIGKGYALDAAAEILLDWGLQQALVHCGQSTILALAPPPSLAGWPVSIRDPRDESITLGRLHLSQAVLSGSGAHLHGRHIIDPRTGRPACGPAGAWSILGRGGASAAVAARADALSTAFMIVSCDEIAQICSNYQQGGGLTATLDPGDDRLRFHRFGAWPPMEGLDT